MADEDGPAPATPAAPGAPARPQAFGAYLVGQARWLLPLTLAVLVLTVVLIVLSQRDGGTLATILALDLTYVGVVLPPVMLMWERSASAPGATPPDRSARGDDSDGAGGRERRRPLGRGQRRALWATAAVSWLAATALVTVATVRMAGDDDDESPVGSDGLVIGGEGGGASPPEDCRAMGQRDPDELLSGEVVVGIEGHHPGWSFRDGDDAPPDGFDIDLAEFLGESLGFEPVYRDLRPFERETALQNCEVDLVIANYSMTRSRSQRVDFAGPYFLDESGLLCNDAKVDCRQVVPDTRVCVVEGTIAWEEIVRAQVADSIRRCLERFTAGDDEVAAYSTDRSILEAYDHWDDEIDASIGTAEWRDIPGHPVSAEQYGIGLPNDSPALCEVLAEAVRDYLDARWDLAFRNNLAASQPKAGHKPASTDVGCYDG